MNTDTRAFLIEVIKKWYTYTDEELSALSDYEVSVIGTYTMKAAQVAHGKGRSFACVVVTLIPVIIVLTTAINYLFS